MTLDREPSRTGLALTGGAGLLAAVGTLLAGGGLALVGGAVAVAGVYRTSRYLLGAGVAAMFVGVFAASTTGVQPGLVVLGMAGTVLAWDIGENSISVAEQLRATARTERLEVVHAATSTLVAAVFSLGAYIVFLLSTGGQPGLAVALLVIGAVTVLVALN